MEEGVKINRGQAKRWRDNGELRGAIRSGVAGLGENLGKVHVISADLAMESDKHWQLFEDDEANATATDLQVDQWTIGQIPSWVNWQPDDVKTLSWHFHSSVFRLPRDNDGALPLVVREGAWGDEGTWRAAAMPSFNSFAIESRIGWVEGLAEHL